MTPAQRAALEWLEKIGVVAYPSATRAHGRSVVQELLNSGFVEAVFSSAVPLSQRNLVESNLILSAAGRAALQKERGE